MFAIFGKIGRFASEEVTLHLLKTKCIPVLLYGLETLPLDKSQISSIDFVINRFFMKLFNTNNNNIEIVSCCQQEFCFSLPSITLAHRTENVLGQIRQCEKLLVKRLLCMLVIILCDVTDHRCTCLLTRVCYRYLVLPHCMCVWTALFHTLFLS